MIPQSVFKKHKLDAASLKLLFEKRVPKDTPKKDGKKSKSKPEEYGYPKDIKRLVDILQSRIIEGRTNNLRDYQTFAAIDQAYDSAFHQTTPTLVNHVCDQKMSYEESLKVVQGWRLSWDDCFSRVLDDNGNQRLEGGQPMFRVNKASMVNAVIPLVKAYVTIRTAKLYTDRDQIPLFKFEPLRATTENRILCEILTSIIEGMVTQLGYRAELKDIILHTLLYGICLTFPQEAWYVEKQEGEDGKDHIIKEGVRYLQPHPTRFFYDLMYRTSSFNSDSGCKFAGHWRVQRYSEVEGNPDYYNKGAISYGTNWFTNTYAGTYFSDFYPCTIQFPTCPPANESSREDAAAYYTVADADRAIFTTDLFCKLVPKDYGIGTYKHPVWFRFVMASDDTIVFAEPLSYAPVVYFGYDADGNRVRNASMALELIPHQDIISNTLNQIRLTAKQNLANVIFYDKNVINAQQIKSLNNSGEMALRGLNFVEMDGQVNSMAQLDHTKAFHPVALSKSSIQELMQALNMQLSICERMLSFSAQELASAASHQQSKAEVVTIAGSVSVRVAYTGTFIDDGIDAWKKQLADAAMAYMSPEFIALINPETPDLEKHLKKLGFTMVDPGGGRVKAKIKASKKAIMPLLLEGLASTRDGPDRGTDKEASQVQMQTWQAVAQNPVLSQQVGAKAILTGIEEAAKLGGASSDFKIDLGGSGLEEPEQAQPDLQAVAKQIQDSAVEQAVAQTGKLVEEQVVKPATAAIAKQQEQMNEMAKEVNAVAEGAAATQVAVAEMQQVLQQLSDIVKVAMSAPPAPPIQTDEQVMPSVSVTAAAPLGAGEPLPPQVA